MQSRWEKAHEKSEEIGTGSQEPAKDYREIIYPFGKYEITVRLTKNNEFIGISEVKINKDFLSYEQKTTTKGFHDVEKFYRE
jgi:hypothetical protein